MDTEMIVAYWLLLIIFMLVMAFALGDVVYKLIVEDRKKGPY
jgi:hypothetical protein|nr:MAG TPA: hypothetical protein [Crassvirales sp.]DAX25644.1 MAG TPA: hypothetical protein [Crassvirales sp.]